MLFYSLFTAAKTSSPSLFIKKKFKKRINNEKHLGIFGNGDNFLCLPLLYFSVDYLSSSVKLTVHACFSF